MSVSTHVLDVSRGMPAQGVPVAVMVVRGTGSGGKAGVASWITDADGRAGPHTGIAEGAVCELVFDLRSYFSRAGVVRAFFDVVTIRFRVPEPRARCHVPLLVTPWSYTTYRGS